MTTTAWILACVNAYLVGIPAGAWLASLWLAFHERKEGVR